MKTKQRKCAPLLAVLVFALCVMVLAIMPFTAGAEDVTLQGSGTRNDPYIVTNAGEFAEAMLGENVFVKLGNDFEVLTDIVVSKNLAIDLNGHQLTISSQTGILVQDSGRLEIADLTGGGKGKIYNKLNVTPNTTITNYGTLYIDGVIIDAFYGTYSVENYGIFEMGGGEITDGIYNYGTGTLSIHNGTVSSNAYGIINVGTMTVTGGTINGGSQCGIYNGVMNGETAATLTVTGGTISGGNYGIVNFENVTLSGGDLVNGILSDTVIDSLAEGYAFFDESGNPIALEAGQTAITANISIGRCNAHIGGTATCTAQANCAACGTAYGELAAHDFGETDVCVLCKAVKISEKNFPDEIFRTYIKDNFDKDGDGVLSAEEIANVTELNISSKGIVTLQGIEYFTSLDYLVCDYNYLTSLDVSNCTALTSLYCRNNQLISLDVSGCTALAALYCSNNQLISLDVSDCIALIELSCNDNQLTNLDLTNTNITSFIDSNQSLNITIDEKTMSYTMPAGFDAAKATNVTGGSFNGNVLTVNNGAETVTYEYKTDNGDNVLTVTLTVTNPHTHDFGETDVCACGAVNVSEITFPDDTFRNFVSWNLAKGDDILTPEEIAAVTVIIMQGDEGVRAASLQGIEIFTALEKLDCRNHNLTSLDLSQNTELTELYCGGNKLAYLDLDNNTKIEIVDGVDDQTIEVEMNQNDMFVSFPAGITAEKIMSTTGATLTEGGWIIGENVNTFRYSYHTGSNWIMLITVKITNPHAHTIAHTIAPAFAASEQGMYYESCTSCGHIGETTFAAADEYFLFGQINGVYEYDIANLGMYQFKDGKLTVKWNEFNYIGIKTGDGKEYRLIKHLIGEKTATFYETSETANFFWDVDENYEIEFTLKKNADGTLTVSYRVLNHILYFTDTENWGEGNVYIYLWDDSIATANVLRSWPGEAMNFAYTNEQGQNVYSFEFPISFGMKHVIFNNGGSGIQTVDIRDFKTCNHYTLGAWDGSKYNFNVVEKHTFGADHVCTYCGAKKKRAEASQVSLTLGGDIGINFYWMLDSSVIGDASAYFLVTLPNGNTKKIMVAGAPMGSPVGEETLYYKITGLVAAKEMAEVIKVDLYAGGEVIASAECSVRDYAKRVFEYDANNTYLVPMMEAMLYYGAASQMLFGHNTDDLANNICEAFDVIFMPDDLEAAKLIGSVTGITPTSFSCILETKTTLRHYFTIDSGGVADYTFKVDDAEVEPTLHSGNTYYVDIENISATDMDRMYDFTITNGEETLTITAGVICYVYSVVVNKDNVDLVSPELLKTASMAYHYGTRAKNYFDSTKEVIK